MVHEEPQTSSRVCIRYIAVILDFVVIWASNHCASMNLLKTFQSSETNISLKCYNIIPILNVSFLYLVQSVNNLMEICDPPKEFSRFRRS